MRRREFLALAAAAVAPSTRGAPAKVEAMGFSSLQPGTAFPAWLRPYAFPSRPRHTEFALVADEGRTVLRARSSAATSGMARELKVDLGATPLIAWRWKVMNLISQSDLARKSGDDFPARLYVTFDNHSRALCYVWDVRSPPGTIASNAYSSRVQMVVAESGAASLRQWKEYERDVAADFRRAFKSEPPPTSGVVVSVDTDNTGESAESYFGDIEFRAR